MNPGDLVRALRGPDGGVYVSLLGQSGTNRWRFVPAGTICICVKADVEPAVGVVKPANFLFRGELVSCYQQNFEVIDEAR